MTPSEASAIIGCSPQHVRYLCRIGIIPATKRPLRHDPNGFEYHITAKEAERYRDNRPRRGPRVKIKVKRQPTVRNALSVSQPQ